MGKLNLYNMRQSLQTHLCGQKSKEELNLPVSVFLPVSLSLSFSLSLFRYMTCKISSEFLLVFFQQAKACWLSSRPPCSIWWTLVLRKKKTKKVISLENKKLKWVKLYISFFKGHFNFKYYGNCPWVLYFTWTMYVFCYLVCFLL